MVEYKLLLLSKALYYVMMQPSKAYSLEIEQAFLKKHNFHISVCVVQD